MQASHTTDTTTVMRSRLRSPTDEPPMEDEMPPPNRSDMPPPRPLCNKMARASAILVITNMIEKIKIGGVIIGTIKALGNTETNTKFTDVA